MYESLNSIIAFVVFSAGSTALWLAFVMQMLEHCCSVDCFNFFPCFDYTEYFLAVKPLTITVIENCYFTWRWRHLPRSDSMSRVRFGALASNYGILPNY